MPQQKIDRGSWIKKDSTPIWWPPKMDDMYDPFVEKKIQYSQAFGGWVAFIICYGIIVFAAIAFIKLTTK